MRRFFSSWIVVLASAIASGFPSPQRPYPGQQVTVQQGPLIWVYQWTGFAWEPITSYPAQRP